MKVRERDGFKSSRAQKTRRGHSTQVIRHVGHVRPSSGVPQTKQTPNPLGTPGPGAGACGDFSGSGGGAVGVGGAGDGGGGAGGAVGAGVAAGGATVGAAGEGAGDSVGGVGADEDFAPESLSVAVEESSPSLRRRKSSIGRGAPSPPL